jgi:general secretion pathway protein C
LYCRLQEWIERVGMKRWPLLTSFLLFLALCVSVAYWGMQLFKPPVRPVALPQAAKAEARLENAAGLFGGRAAAVAVASNFQLKGVVVAGNRRESVAILVADGKPAQAVRANAEIMPGVKIQEVHPQYVLLSENGIAKRVDLPEASKIGKLEAGAASPLSAMQPPPGMGPINGGMQQIQPIPALQPVQPMPAIQPLPGNDGVMPNPNPNPAASPMPGSVGVPGMR